MYRMLVVDDEPEVVDSIYELLIGADFDQLDILKTNSSREASSIINSMKIDILLTDIRMPGITGLQLVEMARVNWPECRALLLTGYNEFEYVYTAIKIECDDYLLKTASNKEIIDAVQNSINKLEKSLQNEELMAKAREQMKKVIPWLQKEYILDIIKGETNPSEISQEKFNELELPLDIGYRTFVLFGRLDELPQEEADKALKSEYMLAIRLIVEETLSRYSNKVMVEYDRTSFVCLIQEALSSGCSKENIKGAPAEEIVILKGAVETLQDIARKSLNTTISCALYSAPVEWELVGEKFSLLKKILDFCSGFSKEAFLTDKSFTNGVFERISSNDNDLMANEVSKNIQNISTLANYLERGMRDKYFQLLAEILNCLRGMKSKNNNLALEIYFSLSNCLLSYINRWKIADSIAFKIGMYKLTRVDEHTSWEAAAEYIQELSNAIFDTQKSDQDKISTAAVNYVQQYIQNHINEELSLGRLAELVYFNPSYLSRLFKQVTGMNLSEYIVEARILKARALLTQTDLKIHEITKLIGFESAAYFGRIFKKSVNMTPQEYRELNYKR